MGIEWKDEYAIGIAAIDEQHKKLFEISARMLALLKNEMLLDKYDNIVEIINELRDYTKYHFEEEEAYMERIGYRKLLSQKVSHKDFLDKMADIDLLQIDNGQNQYLLDILNFVLDWLVEHIMKDDKLIAGKA